MSDVGNPLVRVVWIEVARGAISVPEDNVRLYQPVHVVNLYQPLHVVHMHQPAHVVQDLHPLIVGFC